uniref:Uncharacterized protein n=1 Tax=Rhizophora mucronata TaxID=61149 RepID=A0A2P2N9Z0_RHIMU
MVLHVINIILYLWYSSTATSPVASPAYPDK